MEAVNRCRCDLVKCLSKAKDQDMGLPCGVQRSQQQQAVKFNETLLTSDADCKLYLSLLSFRNADELHKSLHSTALIPQRRSLQQSVSTVHGHPAYCQPQSQRLNFAQTHPCQYEMSSQQLCSSHRKSIRHRNPKCLLGRRTSRLEGSSVEDCA